METKVEPTRAKVAWSENKFSKNDNLRSMWEDFSQSTGFHAVNKLAFGSYKLRCFWWTLAILCMSTYMSYNITKELMNYYTYPTVTNIKVDLLREIEFPAVTICNQSPFSKWRINQADPELEEYFNVTSLLGKFVGPIDWKTQFLGPTFRDSTSVDFWRNISMNPADTINLCMMEGVSYNPCATTMKFEYTSLGLCGTVRFNASGVRRTRKTGRNNNFIAFGNILHDDYVLGSDSGAGLTVILHEPDVHPDAATSSFQASPGTTTYAVIKKSTFKYLPPPHKAFGHTSCVDTTAPDFNNTLEFFDTYTYEQCVMECRTKKIFEMCGCSLPQDHESLTPKCSIFKASSCYKQKQDQLELENDYLTSCACEIPCSFSTYDVKVSASKYPSRAFADFLGKFNPTRTEEYIQQNMLEIRIYYENLMIQSTEQAPQYTIQTLIGNLGGHMGICLGASILTLTELGEFFVIVFINVIERITHRGRNNR